MLCLESIEDINQSPRNKHLKPLHFFYKDVYKPIHKFRIASKGLLGGYLKIGYMGFLISVSRGRRRVFLKLSRGLSKGLGKLGTSGSKKLKFNGKIKHRNSGVKLRKLTKLKIRPENGVKTSIKLGNLWRILLILQK